MQVKLIDGAVVIETAETQASLSTQDFADKPLVAEVTAEPAFYVALGKAGLMERCVSVTVADRKTVAALVGNWIAEGFQPVPCDTKTFAKHVRSLVAANKPAKAQSEPSEAATAPATGEGGDS